MKIDAQEKVSVLKKLYNNYKFIKIVLIRSNRSIPIFFYIFILRKWWSNIKKLDLLFSIKSIIPLRIFIFQM